MEDNVYYDALITNIVSNNSTPPPASYLGVRSIPLLKNTTNYKLSIIRFALPTQTLPVFIPSIVPNQSNPNLTTYNITFGYGAETVTTPVIFESQSSNIPAPPMLSSGLQANSTYYYVYSVQYMLKLINTTFQNCLTQLGEVATLPVGITAPYITLNDDLETFTLNMDATYYGVTSGVVNMFFNRSMNELFSFPAVYNTSSVNEYALISNVFQNGSEAVSDVKQEYSTLATWCPIKSIVFTTSQIPVVSGQYGTPSLTIENISLPSNASASSFNVITDLVANDFDYRGVVLYAPTAQYRYISLQPNSSVTNIDIQIYWQDRLGNLNPVYLPTNTSCSIKMLFTRFN